MRKRLIAVVALVMMMAPVPAFAADIYRLDIFRACREAGGSADYCRDKAQVG